MTDLDTLRASFARFLVGLLWCHVALVAVGEMILGQGFSFGPVLAAALLAGVTTAFWWNDATGPATRIVSAVALIGMAAVFLFALAAHPWQIDLHMYFFACLAVLVGWCDWRVILAAAAATALHHLALDRLMPALVFPGDSAGGDLARVVLHAVIVAVETGVLIWTCRTIEGSFAALADSEQAAQTQLARMRGLENAAVEARGEAETARRQGTRQLADTFEQAVGEIVAKVSAAASELQGTAQGMSATADRTATQSTRAAEAAGDASGSVDAAAGAAEELGQAVGEIGRQVDGSAGLVQAAVTDADATVALVGELSAAASRIGDVVGLISHRLADQSPGAQRHHRGGAGRRGGPRLRRGRLRGQGARFPDDAGDGGDLRADRPHPGRHGPGRVDHRLDHGPHPRDQRRHDGDRGGGRRAGRGDPGDRPDREPGRLRDRGRHAGRGGAGGGGRRDAIGRRAGPDLGLRALARGRAPQRRGRAVPLDDPRGLSLALSPGMSGGDLVPTYSS
ncbi:hypothetical protein OCOJLMKI_3392 [Methylobacterium iners]|uniref:Chemotaxis protein n=1 Tax=Methylobacterium iners TaxID=418707 RepID=A0ABQ4RZ91_9HYPH|nr:hypothetical protein OCOJLMKI_3392 [Methylobacterium iners]